MLKINVRKNFYQNEHVFSLDFSLESAKNEDIFLLGKSGSGKTTVLNMIAGIVEPDMGEINVGGKAWYNSDKKENIKIQNRDIGYLFQDYRLFKNMNVEDNVYYGMKKKNKSFLENLLKAVELENYSKASVRKLSGGQKQRVALLRAIAKKPKILLLDEPFSALDFNLKKELIITVKKLQRKFEFRIIMVSHDLREVMNFEGKLIYMEDGRIKKEEYINGENKKSECFLEKWFSSLDN